MEIPEPSWPVNLPRIPGLSNLQDLIGLQAQAMAQMPVTVSELNRAVAELGKAIEAARSAIVTAQEVSERLERASGELEEPVRALKPGIERLRTVLEHPAIDEIPRTIQAITHVAETIDVLIRRFQNRADSVSTTTRSVARLVGRVRAQTSVRIHAAWSGRGPEAVVGYCASVGAGRGPSGSAGIVGDP